MWNTCLVHETLCLLPVSRMFLVPSLHVHGNAVSRSAAGTVTCPEVFMVTPGVPQPASFIISVWFWDHT